MRHRASAMSIYRVLPDGTIATDDLDAALALSAKMAERHAATAPQRAFSVNGEQGLVTVRPPPKPAKTAVPDATAEKVAELVAHARGNPDTIGILAHLQSAGGGSIATPEIALAIGLDELTKLSGKLAGIVKTANRLGLDPNLIMVRSANGYNENRVISYRAGKGLLAAPPLTVGTVPNRGGDPV